MKFTLRLHFPDDFRHNVECDNLEDALAAMNAVGKMKLTDLIMAEQHERSGWAFCRSALIGMEYFPEGSRLD